MLEKLGALTDLYLPRQDFPQRPRESTDWGIYRIAKMEPPWFTVSAAGDECANVLGDAPLDRQDRDSSMLFTAFGFRSREDARRFTVRMDSIRQLAETTERTGLASPLEGTRRREEGTYYCAIGFVPHCRGWALLARAGPHAVIDVQVIAPGSGFERDRLLLKRFANAAKNVLKETR